MLLQNRTSVVTGASQGIGEAVAVAYAAQGARVAIVDVNDQAGAAVAQKIRESGGQAEYFWCDVSKAKAVDECATQIRDKFGVIEILVNNAGITRPAMLHKMSIDQWHSVIDVHLHGSFYWLKAVVDGMISRNWGRIIFTSSSTAQNGSISQINYAAAKSGMLGMVRTAARELGKHNILVNAVAPAAATEMTRTIREDPKFAEIRANMLAQLPLHRDAAPDEVAPTYVYLASEMSTYMTGQVLSVDGGWLMVR
jgi:3-oxoacyl-[acyl-carrier protein] reductase